MARKVKGGRWRADAEGTNVKGGRKRGECRKKGQEEDGDHPRTVEKKTESQNIRNGEVPSDPPKSTCLLFRGC